MAQWDAPLQALLNKNTLISYALLDHNTSACLASCGQLSDELWREGCDQPAPLAQQLHTLFHTGVYGRYARRAA